MITDDDKRLWAEWCYYLRSNTSIDKEDIFTQKLVTLLEKMGWSQFSKELERERTIKVGSNQTIRTDIVLNQLERCKSIVIELKQPGLGFNKGFREQLFSYMRQIKADVGMLVGSSIELYHDAPHGPSGVLPLLLFRLDIHEAERLGAPFVNLLCKDNYGTAECDQELQHLAKQYKENLDQQSVARPSRALKPENTSRQIITSLTGFKDTSDDVIAVLERWLKKGKTTPWGHNLKRGNGYSQAALIDACLCVDGGMTRREIARNSSVSINRVMDHIDNDLKVGKRNNSKPIRIRSRFHNGEDHEYIDSTDQPW